MSDVTPRWSAMLNATFGGNRSGCVPPYGADRLPLLLLYVAVLLVGLPANLLTLLLSWQQVRRKNVLGVYLWSLSLCDLTYLLTLPLWADYVMRGHEWRWSATLCRLTGYIFFTNMYVSIFLLCCVSCDRYRAVVRSLESRGRRRLRHAAAVTAAVVLLVAAAHSAVFTMRDGGVQPRRRCFEPSRSDQVTGFSAARFVIGFLLPLLLLAATNRRVLTSVQRSAALDAGQKRRVRRLAAAVVLLFLVCFGPYHLVLLVRAVSARLDASCRFQETLYSAYSLSLGLSTVNSAVNPVLYVLSSSSVRKDVRRGLAQLCAWTRRRPTAGSSGVRSVERNAGTGTDTARHAVGPEEAR